MVKMNSTIEEVLEKEDFSEEEKKAFREMISFAKIWQKGMEDNLKSLIDAKMKEILK